MQQKPTPDSNASWDNEPWQSPIRRPTVVSNQYAFGLHPCMPDMPQWANDWHQYMPQSWLQQPPPNYQDAAAAHTRRDQDRPKTVALPGWWHMLTGACCCAVSITVITALVYFLSSGFPPSPPPVTPFPTTNPIPTTPSPKSQPAAGAWDDVPWWLVAEESREALLVDDNEVRPRHNCMPPSFLHSSTLFFRGFVVEKGGAL